ncbi:MAG: histidinol dehydrogenase, partial [Oxalobacteraceae bacterium]
MNIIPFPDRAEWPALLARPVQSTQQIDAIVAPIMEQVRTGGDAALIDLTQRFDKVTLTPETLQVSVAELDAAEAQLS